MWYVKGNFMNYPASDSIEWSHQANPGNTWIQVSTQVQASNTTMTVFIMAENPNPWNLDAWIDDAEVIGP